MVTYFSLKKWQKTLHNRSLEQFYEQFLNNMSRIVVAHACFEFLASSIKESLKNEITENLVIPLSNDFPEGFTTKISFNDIKSGLISGELIRQHRHLIVVNFCTHLEIFIKKLKEHLFKDIEDCKKTRIYIIKNNGKRYELKNTVLKILILIHDQLEIHSVIFDYKAFKRKQKKLEVPLSHEIDCLYKFFLIRNCIVHNNGFINKNIYNQFERLSIKPRIKIGEYLEIHDNQIDDFLHVILMTMKSFVYELDKKL